MKCRILVEGLEDITFIGFVYGPDGLCLSVRKRFLVYSCKQIQGRCVGRVYDRVLSICARYLPLQYPWSPGVRQEKTDKSSCPEDYNATRAFESSCQGCCSSTCNTTPSDLYHTIMLLRSVLIARSAILFNIPPRISWIYLICILLCLSLSSIR